MMVSQLLYHIDIVLFEENTLNMFDFMNNFKDHLISKHWNTL